jgi:DNA-binding CsgD family transcriptional regulator
MNISELIDEIYAAAVAPEQWHQVLDRIAHIVDGEGSILFVEGPEGLRWISSGAIRPLVQEWVDGEWGRRNERIKRFMPRHEPRFLTDFDGFTLDELEREPLYTEFLRPRGLGWYAGTAIRLPTGGTAMFSIEKAYRKGPVQQQEVQLLDSLRPHLVRSVALAANAALLRVQTVIAALRHAGMAAAVLRRDGSVVEAHDYFLRSGPAVLITRSSKISFSSDTAQKTLHDSLAAAARDPASHDPQPIVVSNADPGGALVAHIIPMVQFRHDVFLGSTSFLVVTSFEKKHLPDERLFMQLFQLTPTEARVVGRLLQGESVKEIARAQDVATNTIRMQLKSVFAKTGVNRQAQLVSLLAMHGSRLGRI